MFLRNDNDKLSNEQRKEQRRVKAEARDRVSQFTTLAFTQVLKDADAKTSMDGKGRPLDARRRRPIMTASGAMKFITGFHLTNAAKLSSDWGPPR